MKISIPDYSGDYESAEAVPRNLTIQREKSGKKVLSLSVKAENDPADGYILGNMTVGTGAGDINRRGICTGADREGGSKESMWKG